MKRIIKINRACQTYQLINRIKNIEIEILFAVYSSHPQLFNYFTEIVTHIDVLFRQTASIGKRKIKSYPRVLISIPIKSRMK